MLNQYRVNAGIKSFFIHLFLLSITVVCLFPLFWMLRCAFMSNATIFVDKALIPAQLHPENFYTAWTKGNFGMYFFNSVLYTACVVGGIVVIASLAAYSFSRLKFFGHQAVFFLFEAAMMIPLPGSFVPLFVMMNKLHLANTRIGYILCMINVGLSFSILLLKTFFDKLTPDLEDAARIDGCSKLGIWWHVALPLARPALAVIVIFNSLHVWNEYILASLLFNSKHMMPLQKGLMEFNGAVNINYPVLMAGLSMTVIPIICVYLLMQKQFIKGLSSGAVVG